MSTVETFEGNDPSLPIEGEKVDFKVKKFLKSADGKRGIIREYVAQDTAHNLEAINDLIAKKQAELDELIAVRDAFTEEEPV